MQLFVNDFSVKKQKDLKKRVAKRYVKNKKTATRSKTILIAMKLTFVICFVACMHAAATTNGQQVTLNVRNTPVKQVLREIQKQTGLNIIVNQDIMALTKPVTISLVNRPVQEALIICFKDQQVEYTLQEGLIVIRSSIKTTIPAVAEISLPPPLIDVRGRIVNESGEPIAGASIMVKGYAGKGTTTDREGYFILKDINENEILVISGANFRVIEVPVKGRSDLGTLEVVMKVVEGEDIGVTVISTGYQTLPKERATGSFTFINNERLNEQVGTNILDRLKGVASGILFDDNKALSDNKRLNFNIRGLSTINGPQDPLIILDNFPYEGDLNNINPNMIESITLLKDAAAASIWGTKAGNGVIVITTRKSNFNQKASVDFNANVIVTQKPDLFSIPQMSSADYVDVEEMLFNRGAYNTKFNNSYTPVTPVMEILQKRKTGLLSAADSATMIDALKQTDIRDEYNKYFYRSGVTQQYALGVSGGSENIQWRFAGGYDKVVSTLDAPRDRLNLQIFNSYKPFKNLQVDLGAFFTRSNSSNGKPAYGEISASGIPVPYLRFADENGNPAAVAKTYRLSYIDTAGKGYLQDWHYYPLTDHEYYRTKNQLNDIVANTGIHYRFSKLLKAEIRYMYQRQEQRGETLAAPESYFTRDMINNYSQVDRLTGKVTYYVPPGSILMQDNSISEIQNVRGQLAFNKTSGAHEINAIAGAEARQNKTSLKNDRVYGYNPDHLTAANIDYANPYRTYVTGNPSFIPAGDAFGGTNNRFVSFYANGAYTFRSKYSLSGSFRRDASNLFGVHTNDKWTPLWSAGIGWDISRESFFNVPYLEYLKLRATIGMSGNVDQSRSAVTTLLMVGGANYTGYPYALIANFYNPDLKWETVRTTNIGFDFSLFKSTLKGSLDLYQKNGENLFGLTPIDYTAGLRTESIIKNVAAMKSTGFDLDITTNNLKGIIDWSTHFLLSYNNSKTVRYYEGQSTWAGILGSGRSISPVVGKPLYAIASYQWGGLDANGNPQGYLNGVKSTNYSAIRNSKSSADSLIYHGPSAPAFFGALGNTLRWRQLSLNFNILYKLGYYFRRSTINYSSLVAGSGHPDYALRWQKPGDENVTNVPAMVYPSNTARDDVYRLSEATVERADHMRLQYINLAYDFWINGKSMNKNKIQLYVNVGNLGIIWKQNNKNIDPEYSSSLAPAKTYAAGIRANF